MTYRRLLVLVADDATCAARVHVAARLAVAHGCTLAGLVPTGRARLPAGLHSAAQAIEAAEALRDGALIEAEARARTFCDAARAEGVRDCSVEVHEGEAAVLLRHHAACADLVVLSRPASGSANWREDMLAVEDVLAQSPRPTLLLPGDGALPGLGRRVLVAWDDSPGAARAAADALPLLRRADEVHLVAWHPPGDALAQAVAIRLQAVAGWLSSHGVQARPNAEPVHGPVGDALLTRVARLGADLVVMGAYGHARWMERLTGGVTLTALRQGTVPLLMSR